MIIVIRFRSFSVPLQIDLFLFEEKTHLSLVKCQSKGERTRSSHRKYLIQKGGLKNFAKFKAKRLYKGLFFNKKDISLLKKILWHRCFSVNFTKVLRAPFLQNMSSGCFWRTTNQFLYCSLFKYLRVSQFYITLLITRDSWNLWEHSIKFPPQCCWNWEKIHKTMSSSEVICRLLWSIRSVCIRIALPAWVLCVLYMLGVLTCLACSRACRASWNCVLGVLQKIDVLGVLHKMACWRVSKNWRAWRASKIWRA